MKINREDFQKVLRRVAPMVKGRTTMPILSCVKIWSLGGVFHAVTNDGNVFVEASCECKDALEPICVAPGPLLALSGYGPDTLDLSVEKGRLNVKCASLSSLSVVDASGFPVWPTEDMKALGVNTVDLADAVEAVAWAADASPRSYALIMKRVVWIDMSTKNHSMVAMALDGKRLGLVNKSAVVPNARLIIYAEYAGLLIESLREENSLISSNPSWVVAGGSGFKCAIQQVELFEMPLVQFKKMRELAPLVGTIPKDATLIELSTMQSLATYEEKVMATGELSDDGFKLDFVGKTNEFHSVVSVDASVKQPKAERDEDEIDREPNDRAGAKPKTSEGAPKANAFSFDAALLRDVLKHTPGQNITFQMDGNNAYFEGEGVSTALALLRTT